MDPLKEAAEITSNEEVLGLLTFERLFSEPAAEEEEAAEETEDTEETDAEGTEETDSEGDPQTEE